MTREDLLNLFLNSKEESYLLELATSVGKSRMAIEKIKQWYNNKILIVVPKNVLIKNWKDEFEKWGSKDLLKNVTFSTYASFHKHFGNWDIIVFDEAHHLSERCRQLLEGYKCKHLLFLSATVKREHRDFIYSYCKGKNISYKRLAFNLVNAIDNDILPDPTIILIPLTLNNSIINQTIEKNISKANKVQPLSISFSQKWKYRNYTGPLLIRCTQKQYYDDLSSLIDWYKQKSESNGRFRNQWLHKCGERLTWLSEQKMDIVKDINKVLKNFRALTFSARIEQTEKLEIPAINSKVGTDNLDRFNQKKIKHIAAVGMLDEGVNLINCKIGIFQMINSSTRLIVQRSGRIYRHKDPILIFPYYQSTREEEIVNKIITDYKNVIKVNDINCILSMIRCK